MKELDMFYLSGCPYCRKARAALDELMAAKPAYAALSVRWIEEREEAGLANSRDYYNVPSLYNGTTKLYECRPGSDYDTILRSLRAAFDQVLGA